VTGAFSPVGVASVLPPALGPPSATITSPGDGATYALGATVTAAYTCTPGANGGTLKAGTAGCSGPVATGVAIDTSTLGVHAFTVTATDTDGQSAAATSTYTVTTPVTSRPIVTDIRPVGPILAGRMSTISVQTAGAVASLRWNLSGDSRPEVSCDGRQTELTFRAPAQGTDAISVTAVTAAGATGVASAQLNVSGSSAGRQRRAVCSRSSRRPSRRRRRRTHVPRPPASTSIT
jgi:hypothetical protein